MKELAVRTITGSVYVVVLMGAPLLGPWFFFGAYLLLAIFALLEFIRLTRLEQIQLPVLPTIIAGVFPFIQQFLQYQIKWELPLIGLLTTLFLLFFIMELFRNQPYPFQRLAMIFMSLIYIGLPFYLLPNILFNQGLIDYNPTLLAFILTVIWIHDTGAYLVGKSVGKTPLMKRISPKKTIEGLIGGLILGALSILLFALFFPILPMHQLFFLGFVIMVFANFGDLFESMWKRQLGVKDSGKSLPGHGGFLDRLDSLLFALPAVYVALMIIG